jgi:hypothetical protein
MGGRNAMNENGGRHMLQAKDVVAHVDGHWLRNYARDFLSAAQTFDPPKNRFSPVPYYLICHSVELSLKAFLFSAGFKKNDRKRLNHDLEKALRAAEANGLSAHLEITSNDRELFQKANRLYPKKEFEYFESLETIYDPHNFELEALESFALRLYEAIEDPVAASVFE